MFRRLWTNMDTNRTVSDMHLHGVKRRKFMVEKQSKLCPSTISVAIRDDGCHPVFVICAPVRNGTEIVCNKRVVGAGHFCFAMSIELELRYNSPSSEYKSVVGNKTIRLTCELLSGWKAAPFHSYNKIIISNRETHVCCLKISARLHSV